MFKKLASFFAVSLMTVTFVCAADLTHTKDDLKDIKSRVAEKKALLLDVRSLDEWNEGHVKGAIHLPIQELQGDFDRDKVRSKLPKEKIIYTYCAVGGRSLKAGKILVELGYEVRPLKPGFEDLAKAGFATETPQPAQ